ncbi:MAG TPA: leucine-rich repeat domain-containing protein [Pirellulales bacterium]|jgi:hypothetical protein
MPEPTKSMVRSRRFRFSLRTLLAVVIVVAIPVAWIAKERRQSAHEEQVAEQLLQYGFVYAELSGPYDSLELSRKATPQGWWRDLAREIMGERILEIAGPPFPNPTRWPLVSAFNDITPLAGLTKLESLYLRNSQIRDLTPLAGLTNLQELIIYVNPVSDLKPLAGLKNLKTLDIRRTPVSDLKPLASLKNLEGVNINDTQVSDLTPLAGLTKLKSVSVKRSPVSKGQVEALQKALPNCKIEHDPFP